MEQTLDAFEQLLFAIGFGLSGFIRFELAMFALTAYFLLSILSLVRAIVTDLYAMTYGTIGLRELRIMFLLLNALMYFFPPQPMLIAGLSVTYPEILSVAWVTSMLVAFFMSFQLNLRQLNEEKP